MDSRALCDRSARQKQLFPAMKISSSPSYARRNVSVTQQTERFPSRLTRPAALCIHASYILSHQQYAVKWHNPYAHFPFLLTNAPYTLRARTQNRAMTEAFSRLSLSAVAPIQFRSSPCGIRRRRSGNGTGLSPKYFSFPVRIIPRVLNAHSNTNMDPT